ncbi:MAG TPA: site-specific DNA-methyltransferase [Vicinamibacterales bacterium]|nr:site-specific DNA-methyltransferase [Vicinamibacterales bacterium]
MPSTRKQPRLPKPYFQTTLGGASIRFYLGDCVELLNAWAPGTISAIVTSPPYNLGIRYRTYDDSVPRARYLEWTNVWIEAAARALSPAGSLFLNLGAKPTDPWTALDVAQTARRHLQLQNTIHWIKSIAIDRESAGAAAALDRDLAVGHYKPINSERFLNDCHEFVFHFSPQGRTPLDRRAIGVPYQDASNIGRWKAAAANVRCRGNTWFIPYDTIQSREDDRPHPATFPPRLPEYCLRLHGLSRVDVVMDPFLGLGSTAVACARLGVDFVGIEMDEGYLREAVDRVLTRDRERKRGKS